MKKLIASLALATAVLTPTVASASTDYTVKSGDTLSEISRDNGVTLANLRKANNKYDDLILVGQHLTIPDGSTSPTATATATTTASAGISASDKDLMARLVHAEAQGEPYAGKVAVATVVLNRVDSGQFPSTVSGVINQSGQFSPVANGTINNTPSADERKAVEDAIAFRGKGAGSLFFYNPAKAKSAYLASKTVTIVIGNHTFLK
jgi:N-acetylmuramoyl-L-alanine amidase